jgi:hypothetical protein
MEKTIKTLSEIVRKYRNKNMRDAELSQKLSEDLIKTIGIDKLDAVTVIKDLLRSKYTNVSLGDTLVNEKLIDDIIYTFDRCGAEIKGDLEIPNGLHEIEQPLTREQVTEMYATKPEPVEEKVEETETVEKKVVEEKKVEKVTKPRFRGKKKNRVRGRKVVTR